MVKTTLTLRQAWIKAMCDILYSQKTQQVEDYLELINYHTQFCYDQIDELKENARIYQDYKEMHKVFFSDEENIFGHSYANAIVSPVLSINDPIEAASFLLRKNETTRKATMTFVPYGNEKIPCISTIQFLVRENVLNIIYNARGQDMFRKFPCDAMCIAEYGMRLAKKNQYSFGMVCANIASAHIYNKNIEEIKECIAKNQPNNIILTGNALKYQGYADILRKSGFSILVSDAGIPEIQSMNSEEIVRAKAKYAYELFGFPVWVDDVSLYLEAYPMFPSGHTKYILRQLGAEGIYALLNNKSTRAKIVCTLCAFNGGVYSTVMGENNGYLDCTRTIENPQMPLNSIFIGEGITAHRKKAVLSLIQKYGNGVSISF